MIRPVRAVTGWISNLWVDLKASTDASLLGMARFVGLLYGPIDRSLRIDEALQKALRYRLPSHVGWRQAFGGITYLLFIVLVVTGVLLAIYYRPSVEEAYPSIQHIVSEVNFGWLIRDLHVWSANLIIIAVLAHMARVFFEAAYKPPRETNWLIGLMLLFVVLAFGSTGYLLPWDQWAYWTTTEVLWAISALTFMGRWLANVLTGDVFVSGATLSRFFALHVIILPWISLALLVYHFTLVRRRGIAPPMSAHGDATVRGSGAGRPGAAGAAEGVPFFPNHLLRSLMTAVVVVAVCVTVAVLFPRPVADAATPYIVPDELVSTWVPVDVSLALIRYLGPLGFAGFTLLGVSLALVPLFDRRPERRFRDRPVAIVLGLVFFIGFGVAWVVGRQVRSLPPSARPVLETEVREGQTGVPLPDLGPEPIRPADRPAAEPGGREP